jgi:hypothetical protein
MSTPSAATRVLSSIAGKLSRKRTTLRGSKNGTAPNRGAPQCVLHERVESSTSIQAYGRAQKRMLLPAIDGLRDQGAHRFPQHIFFRHSANLAVHGKRANGFAM